MYTFLCLRLLLPLVLLPGTLVFTLSAADPSNPKPCKDPWECTSPPSISGEISGNASLCENQSGTWTVAETITKGEKTRCEELPVEVPLRDVKWNWSITGPETHTGDGKTASKTLVKPGTYTVTFSGWGYADDPCDDNNPYTGYDTFSVEVKSNEWACTTPPSISGEVSGNTSFCAGDLGKWTVNETIIKGEKTRCDGSSAEVPLRDVKWNWSITGPETHTGNGKFAARVLNKSGIYTITFSGWGYADDPCDDDNPYTCYDTVTVEVKSNEWVCATPPSISGEASGPTFLWVEQRGTWTVKESIIKGEKTRCDGWSAKVSLYRVQWNWSITGPETHTGNGKSVSRTLKTPGEYTITFSGWGYADKPCDEDNPYQCTAVLKVIVNGEQSLTIVSRSWINPQFTDRWGDFPADFAYPLPGRPDPSDWVVGTHNPFYYRIFAVMNQNLGDHGGTPARDGRYRLWTKFVLQGRCSNGNINNLAIQIRDTDGGFEGPFEPPGGVDNVLLKRINNDSFEFQFRRWGEPHFAAEANMLQQIRHRTTGRIYLWVKGTIRCGQDNILVASLNAYESFFPTHEVYVDGALVISRPQGPITELWKANPGDPSVVIGNLPPR